MEHLQVAVNHKMLGFQDSIVDAPPEVIDALVTLTKAGLLDWWGSEDKLQSEAHFSLRGPELACRFNASDPDGEGFDLKMAEVQVALLKAALTDAHKTRNEAVHAFEVGAVSKK